ncbi:MAG: uracil-DNA glycosylase [Actinobacteria bacterium]|nr:uracil-DNA glycosylase [Actinomycetota bacterium]
MLAPPSDPPRQRALAATLASLHARIVGCRRCPRLVAWREQVARTKRAAFHAWTYWGRPVTGFGDPNARIALVGLAPAAHGANRTGRLFTGDRSGDFLYAALHRAGLASQPTSQHRDDGLHLSGVYVTAVVRCAPPGNHPLPAERDACRPYLEAELSHLKALQVVVALGGIAWSQLRRSYQPARGVVRPADRSGAVAPPYRRGVPWPAFAHGAEAGVGSWRVLAAYHPSQQNTFTGRLTPAMLDAVLARAKTLTNL